MLLSANFEMKIELTSHTTNCDIELFKNHDAANAAAVAAAATVNVKYK